MKRSLFLAGAMLFAIAARAGCPPTNLTNIVRVRTFGCNVDSTSPLKVKIANVIWDARSLGPDYWEVTLTQRINAVDFPIRIQPGQGVADCCQSAKEAPLSIGSRDCYVEYSVSCDKPEWGINVSSNPPLSFDYERDHPDGFDGITCSRTAPISGTVSGLGASDQVRVLLRRENKSVLNYLITFAVLQQKLTIPLTRHDLELMIDAEAKQAAINDTPAARVAIATRKKLLPDTITLSKQ
jgi:hypothetical protein